MDCRCRKLSIFFCKFLSAVGVLEQDFRFILCNFGAMSFVAKTPWKASYMENIILKMFVSKNDREEESLTCQVHDQAGHRPLF